MLEMIEEWRPPQYFFFFFFFSFRMSKNMPNLVEIR